MVAQHTLLHWEALAKETALAGCSSRIHPKGLPEHEETAKGSTNPYDMKWLQLARSTSCKLCSIER
jgi:hypothetical protein